MRHAHMKWMGPKLGLAAAIAMSLGTLSLGGLASGCAAGGIGDPCVPEAVPSNGFTPNEVYVETSAVQCRTRVCVVYHLRGNPEVLQSEGCPAPDCVDDETGLLPGVRLGENAIERVFCSCRCRAGEGNPNLPICACGGGYHCADEGYCVPHEGDDTYCDAAYEANCPSAGCDLTTNRCR